MTEVIETVWPDENFAQFGGHVLERLFQTKAGMMALRHKRFRVRVTIEIDPITQPGDVTRATVAQSEPPASAGG